MMVPVQATPLTSTICMLYVDVTGMGKLVAAERRVPRARLTHVHLFQTLASDGEQVVALDRLNSTLQEQPRNWALIRVCASLCCGPPLREQLRRLEEAPERPAREDWWPSKSEQLHMNRELMA